MAGQSTPEAAPVQPPQRRTDDLLATLAERIGARFDAGTVFGAPVERDGVTVIPVAAVRFGIGGGGGSDPSKGQGGEGGGGGGSASAAGYIEIKEGRSRFVPVVHPARMLMLVGALTLAGLAIVRPLLAGRRPSRLLGAERTSALSQRASCRRPPGGPPATAPLGYSASSSRCARRATRGLAARRSCPRWRRSCGEGRRAAVV